MTNDRLLTKSEHEACIPTEEELRNYLAIPDDEVAAKLRKELSPESFGKIGFIILYTEKIEKAQDTKSVKATKPEVLSQVHAQLRYYLDNQFPYDFRNDIELYTVALEGELTALKRGIDEQK